MLNRMQSTILSRIWLPLFLRLLVDDTLAWAAAFNHATSLYNTSVPVVPLTGDNFDQIVFGKVMDNKPAHFVEFYASWCGHCQVFAETWAHLAKSNKNWQNVVRISAVNCALSSNLKLCSDNDINSYPKLKYFSPLASEPSHGFTVPVPSEVGLRRSLVDLIMNDYKVHRFTDWPNFDYLPNTLDMPQLWRFLSLDHVYTHVAVIFEDISDKYTGAEFLLDFSSFNWIYARRTKNTNPLAASLGIEIFPAVVILEQGRTEPIYRSDLRSSVMNEVNDIFSSRNLAVLQMVSSTFTPIASTTVTLTTTVPSIETMRQRFILSETDLLIASRFSLFDALASQKEFSGVKLQALKDYVQLLSLYFPPVSNMVQTHLSQYGFNFPTQLERSRKAKALFTELHSHLQNNDDKPITYDQWSKVFATLEAKHDHPFPINASYVHCRGSEPKFRGYSCGLWAVFHTLTVNAYYERGNKPDFDVFSVLEAIKGYIEHFFACRFCAEHFVEMLTRSFDMHEFVHNAADVVLYLWNAHNIVNNRLKGLPTEDPQMRKVQFPADFLCPHCRNETTGEWRTNVVLYFLTGFYGSNLTPHVE